MAKAAVELPDPLLAASEAGKPLTSTDDLLAQLAGEEIDRLLAEVEEPVAEAKGPAPASASAPDSPAAPEALQPKFPQSEPTQTKVQPEAPAGPINLAGTPEQAPEPAGPTPAPEDAALVAAAAAAQPELTEELDAFFRNAAPAPAEAAKSAEPAETSAAERAALDVPEGSPAAGSAAAIKEATSIPEVLDEPLPLYLKPLEWMNAPLEACPPGLRDFIGKAAIVTLVNAAAVLAYVMLFRRP